MIHGIKVHYCHHPVGQNANRVEKRRRVSPCGYDDTPQVADIAEKTTRADKRNPSPALNINR